MQTWEVITIAVMWFGSGGILVKIAVDQLDGYFEHVNWPSIKPERGIAYWAFIIIMTIIGGPIFGLIGLVQPECFAYRKSQKGDLK